MNFLVYSGFVNSHELDGTLLIIFIVLTLFMMGVLWWVNKRF